ncbi:MAG: hypothetical protein ACE5OZ_01610 [Candidatus Heimdallarchaeota archaeon]
MIDTTTEHNSEPLEDSNAFATLKGSKGSKGSTILRNINDVGVKLLILVDKETNPKPLIRFLHNLLGKIPVQLEKSRLIYYKIAKLTPYVVIPTFQGIGTPFAVLRTDNPTWELVGPNEHQFLRNIAAVVDDVVPELKTEVVAGGSLKEIAGHLTENQETLPDLIVMERRSENLWRRLRRLLGLSKTTIQEVSDELSLPVVRVSESYDRDPPLWRSDD